MRDGGEDKDKKIHKNRLTSFLFRRNLKLRNSWFFRFKIRNFQVNDLKIRCKKTQVTPKVKKSSQ